MLREVSRASAALGGAARQAGAADGSAVSRTRAVAQIALTVVLLPLTLFVLFGPREYAPASRDAASAMLGAIVMFWLKD